MKQLLITDRFLPHRGGSRVYYHEICHRLGIPALTSPEKKSSEFDTKQSFRIIRRWGIRSDYTGIFQPGNPILNILLNYLPPLVCMLFWSLLYTITMKPRIIHAGGFQFAGFSALVIRKIFSVPYLVYTHGEEILAVKQSRYLSRYLKWILKNSSQIIANSEYTKTLLLSLGIKNNTITIVNPGVNEKFFIYPESIEQVRNKYQLDKKLVLLSVGRLTKRKGHIQILNILPKLIPLFPELKYVIAGTGEEYQALKNYVEGQQLESHVVFTGNVNSDELRSLYHLSDLFVLANRSLNFDIEGFGMVFLEAGAAGKMVIGGRSGGAVEAVQHCLTGFLVDIENPLELMIRLQQSLGNRSLRDNLGTAGRTWAKLFLWSRQIEKITAVVRKCLGDKIDRCEDDSCNRPVNLKGML